MLEIPEATVLARQINDTLTGKRIVGIITAHSPHKFAWFSGQPEEYQGWLIGQTIDGASAHGGMVEIHAGRARLLFGDGVNLRFHSKGNKRPSKHQLLMDFEDETALSASVQMYGGLWCFQEGRFENPYYQAAVRKPSPLSREFDRAYFDALLDGSEVSKMSAKAWLATEQRIPGLGNGVLQDILYNARIHPKRKIGSLSEGEKETLFGAIKDTLADMTGRGGRDTEKDLFGKAGGYKTKASKLTAGNTCPVCGGIIRKESYLGGSIYYCDRCQKI